MDRRISPRRVATRLSTAGLFLLGVLAASCNASEETEPAAENVSARPTVGVAPTNLTALRSGDIGLPFPIDGLLQERSQVSPADASWPTLTYLVGEVHRRHGDFESSRKAFRELATWAAGDPYGDTWGGSGLAAFALWRWLQILDRAAPSEAAEVDRALEGATVLGGTRLYRGMVRVDPLQPGLPQLDEGVTKLSAHVAWKNDRKDAAKRWFLNYLTIASSPFLDDVDRQILDEIIASGMATRARLDLFRSKRLLTLVNTSGEKDKAAAELERLWRDPSAPTDVRADAGYELANYKRSQPDRVQVLGILDSVLGLAADSSVAEKALFRRATVHNQEKGRGDTGDRNLEAFRNNLRELLQKFPRGQLADDALYQLATDYLFEQDLKNAELYYGKLREFEGDNDFKDSAYYLPAMGFIGRGPGQDLKQADKLLAEYVQRYPTGVFRQRATFWRGRIAEQRNDGEQARDFFRQVIEQDPYTYYGIRARMHLNDGKAASRTDLPVPGSKTRTELRDAWRKSSVDKDLTAKSPYADRLREAVTVGLYGQLLGIENTFNRRLDNIPLSELDADKRLPAVGLLLALRQDALAAKDKEPSAENDLKLAGVLGHKVGDWPLAIGMTTDDSEQERPVLSQMQKDPHYLATAYPVIYGTLLKDASWAIDGSPDLSRSLMYAVMRNESQFYARAISSVGALGLFQFLPKTFEGLNGKWKLIEPNGPSNITDYLLDPSHNMKLWARWAKDDLKIPQRGEVDIGLMEHQAGIGNVKRWRLYWDTVGAPGDLEYRIETARFPATSAFARSVLADLTIVDSAGLFADAEPKP